MYDTISCMDIDALKASHMRHWNRFHQLAHSRRLTGPEIDELSVLYRQVTADLAKVRSQNPDQDVISYLSGELLHARARLTGTAGASLWAISRWFRHDLPAALYRIRYVTIAIMLIFIAMTALQTWWILRDPAALSMLGSPEQLKNYATTEFSSYYSQDTNASFMSYVWTNNAFIALRVVAGGITGFYPILTLWGNAQNLGISAAVVIHYAGPAHFFSFILPHGIPELTAIWISTAAGLRLFWAWLVPGRKTRGQALGEAGRSMITVGLGMVILLFLCGAIEGFVTPSDLPLWLKITCGVTLTAGVWIYTFVAGGRAYRAGVSGDLDEDAGYATPVI